MNEIESNTDRETGHTTGNTSESAEQHARTVAARVQAANASIETDRLAKAVAMQELVDKAHERKEDHARVVAAKLGAGALPLPASPNTDAVGEESPSAGMVIR